MSRSNDTTVQLCACGCGEAAPFNWETGKPWPFVLGHERPVAYHARGSAHNVSTGDAPRAENTIGLCQCGCGQPTKIAPKTITRLGHVKGQPMRFLKSHQFRKSPVDYVEEDRGYDTPCWIWQLAMNPQGYGCAWDPTQKRMRPAHVVVYERVRGSYDPALDLDHLCRVRECVNPEHIEPVPPIVNYRRGARTKLDAEKVAWIRANYGRISQIEMAKQLGVHMLTVHNIVHRKTWSDLD
jgi:hypothetical protein